MIDLDSELAHEYLEESNDRLTSMETDLLTLQPGGVRLDEARMNRIFRSVRSIKGGAGVFKLDKIAELAHQTEYVLTLIRSLQLVLTRDQLRILLSVTDSMRNLIQNPGASNQADILEPMAALGRLCSDHRVSGGAAIDQDHAGRSRLRTLLVEDDFASRLLLQSYLSSYGDCHVAVNGREAVEAVRSQLELGKRYDLICMDIMMPEMDGREAVRQVRALEEEHGILSTYGAKIIMTTAVDDVREVILCFKELCDSYLVKPIDLTQLLNQMKCYNLVHQ